MAASGPKRKVHPNTIAAGRKNVRPHPENLKRGGKQPKAFLTPEELQFCQFVADGAGNTDAARWAGLPGRFPAQHAFDLRKRPLVQKTIEEFAAARKAESIKLASVRREERSLFIHQEFIHRLRTAQTHERIGDLAIAKMLEVGFRSTDEIQPSRNTAIAGGGSAKIEAGTVDIYKPLWLREMEMQLAEQARSKFQQPQIPPTIDAIPAKLSPERAKEYLLAAGGDKERAREAARKDGWQV